MLLNIFVIPNFCPEKHNEKGEIVNKFAEWMKNNDKVQASVAEKIGISPSSLHEIIRLDKIPSIKVAYEIEVYTKGEITVYDWLDQTIRKETKPKITKKKQTKNHKK